MVSVLLLLGRLVIRSVPRDQYFNHRARAGTVEISQRLRCLGGISHGENTGVGWNASIAKRTPIPACRIEHDGLEFSAHQIIEHLFGLDEAVVGRIVARQVCDLSRLVEDIIIGCIGCDNGTADMDNLKAQ